MNPEDGMQMLLSAERQAQSIINDARRERLAMLKQAKEEARGDISVFKAEKREEFREFRDNNASGNHSAKKSLKKQSREHRRAITEQIEGNKQEVIDLLFELVTNVEVVGWED
eukprot:TRINITY_DN9700_c0_g1_i1.p1 TRINITY_DN9700_c0_g1~~TRINITY_DN9700_c0_g1_i1.p1  ORF type:complete len:124 (-),score=35.86 TRINITY_DN9700_c0_g1_i1:70-408(-)